MANLGRVATRYAKAIADSIGDTKKIQASLNELAQVAKVVNSNEELSMVLTSQRFQQEKQVAVLEDVLAKLKVSDETRKTALLLASVRRIDALSQIVEKLGDLVLQSADVIPLRVDAANELTSDEKSKIEKKFHQLLGKNVEAKYAIDPNLIGGLRITANGRTYDGSVSGWLNTFKTQMAEGR